MSAPDFVKEMDMPSTAEPLVEVKQTIITEPDTPVTSKKVAPETVTFIKAPLPPSVLQRLERQKYKYWHFQFVNDNDLQRFIQMLQQAEPSITAEVNYGGKKHADITLMSNGDIKGKMHFLYVNRPDIAYSTKYYVQVHFYDFNDRLLYERIKEKVGAFFEIFARSSPITPRNSTRKRRNRSSKKIDRSHRISSMRRKSHK
jgi:hypothetical protein